VQRDVRSHTSLTAGRFHLFLFFVRCVRCFFLCVIRCVVCVLDITRHTSGRATIFQLLEIRTNLTLFHSIFCMSGCYFLEQLTIPDT
jgi:hypothetical protein